MDEYRYKDSLREVRKYVLLLEGRVVPKARPREGYRLDPDYRDWKVKSAVPQLQRCWQRNTPIDIGRPLVRFFVPLAKNGVAPAQTEGDLDNMMGSVMDAMVDAGILAKDNLAQCVDPTPELWIGEEYRTIIFLTELERLTTRP